MTESVWRRPQVSGLLLAAAGGTLLLAPNEPRWLALTGFVGLLLLCESLELVHGRLLRAALSGLVFGTCANATALFSVIGLLGSFGRLPAWLATALALLLWLAQGLVFGFAGALHGYLRKRGTASWLAFPLALTASLGLLPTLFPWHVAATQVGFLTFVQLADVGGETLIGLLLALVVSATHALFRAPRAQDTTRLHGRAWRAGLALSALLLPLAYGVVRLPQVRELRAQADTLAVGVVQSNVATDDKRLQQTDETRARANLIGLRALTAQVESQGADLTVWGETAYPYPLRREETRAPTDVRRVLGPDVHGPILLGLETYRGFGQSASKYNSAWLLGRDGTLAQRVDKTRLLAFGEYIPLWDLLPPIKRRYASAGFSRGVPGTVQSELGKLGILICYEDLFADSARATVLLGARALVNLTNDAWFGNSREPLLHDQLARLRSIELRRDLVRAVNTGVSSFSSATGEPLVQTRTFERAAFVAQVRLLDERTFYAQHGDWLLPLCLLAVALCLLFYNGEVTRPPRPSRQSRAGTHPSARFASLTKGCWPAWPPRRKIAAA